MELVYEGSLELENGWTSVFFNHPFVWDGTSNVVVAFLNNGGDDDGTFSTYTHPTSTSMCLEITSSSMIDIDNASLTRHSYRNNMRFCVSDVAVQQSDVFVSLVEGQSYNFYGTLITEPGTYYYRWFINNDYDSLVTLHVEMRKIIFVTTTGSGAHDGSSWANAMELQEAMDTAASFTDRTPYLYVKKGTYTGNQNGTNSFEIKANVHAYGGFNGTEPADFDLDNRTQANISQTILFGSNARRVLYQSTDFADNQATVFDGFTIRGGTVNTVGEGGGAYIRKNCTLQNCTITANNATISGTESDLYRRGLAIYNNGGLVDNCQIYNNTLTMSGTGTYNHVYGVGVYNNKGTIQHCNIYNNTVNFIGAIISSWYIYGGGIYDDQNGVILHNQITRNSAVKGGGIYLNNKATVEYCTISNNTTSSDGGGVFTYNSPTFSHCLISNNNSGYNGGGVYNGNGTPVLTHCNIVRNTAVNNGGGLYSTGSTIINNSIVWGNMVGASYNQFPQNTYVTCHNSAVQGGYSGAFALEAENSGTGIGYPMFANPTTAAGANANNVIGDWSLLNGSLCANVGNNDYVRTDVDLAGNVRVQQGTVDIGAYESAFERAYTIQPQAESNIIYVTTTGAGSRDGSSWTNATNNLPYAMETAMICNPPAAVWVAQGTYTLGKTLIAQPNVAVYGGFVGNEPYNYDLSQRDFSTHATIIDGDSAYLVLKQTSPFPAPQNVATTYITEHATLQMPITGNLDVTVCSGTIYDDGGANGNYSANCNGSITIRSFNSNSVITLTGTIQTDSFDDYLKVYNYDNGIQTLIGTYQGPNNISLTSSSDVIVLEFISDGYWQDSGFELNFTCSNCTPEIPSQEEPLFRMGEALFDGFVFQNGFVTSVSDYAGAYLLENINMLNCNFSHNHANGVYAKGSQFENCVFEYNKGYGLYGYGNTNVNNSIARNNDKYGIYFTSTGKLSNSTMQNNVGGLYISNGIATDCTISGNGGENSSYRAIYGTNNAMVVNTSVINNSCLGLYASGGLYIGLNIANNTMIRRGTSSSSVYAGVYANYNARFVNCNIVNNKVELVPYSSGGAVNYNNIYAGVYNQSTGNEFTNCIIWGNKADTIVSNIHGEGTFSYCAVEGGVSGIANITLDSANTGFNSSASYVRFVNPAAAGITQDSVNYRLAAGSVCINVGNPNTTSLNLPTYDLAGSLRIKQQYIDIGAYEYGDVNVLTINDTICLGESFFYNDYFVYPEDPGLFCDTFIYNEAGMDYIAYIQLVVNEVYNINVEASICEGESYAFNGQSYNTAGYYTANLLSVAGCDSIVTLHLMVNPIQTNSFSATACDSYTWNDSIYTASGTYQQTFTSSTGCDSVVTLHLTVNHSAASNDYLTLCRSALPYVYYNVLIGTDTPEQDTLTVIMSTTHGCDSVVTLHVSIVDVITSEFSYTACDYYSWSGTIYTTGGDKVKTFTSSIGCDSVVTLHLTIHHSVEETIQATACDSYTWNGITYTQSGDYLQTFSTIHGCDSVVTLHLTIHSSVMETIQATACDSYTWNDSSYTQTGIYQQTFSSQYGCDSVVTLHLTVHHSVTESVALTICENELPYHYINGMIDTILYQGMPLFSVIQYPFTTVHGCDSIVNLQVTVVPAFTPTLSVAGAISPCVSSSATLSVNGNYNSYLWSTSETTATITVTQPGSYYVTVVDTNGCSGISDNMQLGLSELINETPAICMVGVENNHNLVVWEELSDPDVVSYQIYRENNQANIFEPLAVIPANSPNAYEDTTADPSIRAYRYKITATDSCGGETPMSAFHKTVHLTINQGLGNSWNLIWTPYEGFEFASYKLYRGTANNNLQLIQTMPSTLTSFTDNNPAGDALFYQIEVVMNEGCVRQTRDVTYTGARSNIVYNGVEVATEISVVACESYDWNGQILTQSGDYNQTFHSTLGYDSTVTMHLTLTYPEHMSYERTGCESYTVTWADGYSETFNQSGVYIHSFLNADGCRQVDTLHLSIVYRPQAALGTISNSTQIEPGEEIIIYNVLHQDGYTYVWSNGIVGDMAIMVSPQTATTYSVTVSNPPCTTTSTDNITITVSGIEDYELSGLTLYPNPTNGIVNVEFEKDNVQWKGAKFSLFDMYGKLLLVETSHSASVQPAQIDLSPYADGVYTLQIETSQGIVTRKVVKQNK